jgi:E3 ubiquitin-protein ligase DOA10
MEEGEHSNPLIAICDCIGGSKYTHFKCLRQWFTTQLDPVKINQVT